MANDDGSWKAGAQQVMASHGGQRHGEQGCGEPWWALGHVKDPVLACSEVLGLGEGAGVRSREQGHSGHQVMSGT